MSSLAGVTAGATMLGRLMERRSARAAEVWAEANGFVPADDASLAVEMRRLRNRKLPAFRGAIGDLEIAVVPWRTRPRGGRVWIFAASLPHRAPVFVASKMDFVTAHALGGLKVRGLVEVKTKDEKLDARYYVEVEHAGADALARALPERLRRVLVDAGPHVWTFASRRGGRTLLFAIERYGSGTAEALSRALETFGELTVEPV